MTTTIRVFFVVIITVGGFFVLVRFARGGSHSRYGGSGGIVGESGGSRENRRKTSAVRFAREVWEDFSGYFYTELWRG